MARIAGVDLPNNKRGEWSYLYLRYRTQLRRRSFELGIDFDTKVGEWNDSRSLVSVADG